LGLFGGIGFVGGLAGGLEALEFVEGAEEGALDAGLVATEHGEGVGVFVKDLSQLLVAEEVDVFLAIEILLFVGEAEFEEAGFDAAAAGEAPLSYDHLVDEGGFEGTGGLEVVEEGVAEFVEGLLVFDENDGVFGDEAVFEGIEANGGFAFGGFGAGAELGIAAVGGALLAGCQWVTPLGELRACRYAPTSGLRRKCHAV
jgi:hypothetical protein